MSQKYTILALTFITVLMSFCTNQSLVDYEPERTREDSIPENAVKVTPDTDIYPPILHFR